MMAKRILRRPCLPGLVVLLVLLTAAAPAAGNMSWYALGFRPESTGPCAVETMVDLVYAQVDQTDLRADIYRPDKMTEPCPGVVIVHGGAWRYLDRSVTRGFARILASHGFVTVTVDYRSSKKASWPACLHDVKAAVRWFRANARRFNLDPRRVGAVGDSAGGHLVAMLGTAGPEAGYEGDVGVYTETSSALQAVVAYYGVFDMAGMPPVVRAQGPIPRLLGASYADRPELFKTASPMEYIDPKDPPFMLVHGQRDRVVPVAQSMSMEAALRAAGVPVKLLLVENADHMLVKRGGKPQPSLLEVDRQVVEFLKEKL